MNVTQQKNAVFIKNIMCITYKIQYDIVKFVLNITHIIIFFFYR